MTTNHDDRSSSPTPLEYAAPSPARRPASLLKVYGTLSGGVILALFCLIGLLLPDRGRATMRANVVKCASNLRQIGQALSIYANDYGGRYPDYIEQILHLDTTQTLLVCPTSDEQYLPAGLVG